MQQKIKINKIYDIEIEKNEKGTISMLHNYSANGQLYSYIYSCDYKYLWWLSNLKDGFPSSNPIIIISLIPLDQEDQRH